MCNSELKKELEMKKEEKQGGKKKEEDIPAFTSALSKADRKPKYYFA